MRPLPPPGRESTVAKTVFPTTAGVEADRCPRLRRQNVWPVALLIARSTPLSPSWKMWSPPITGGNSSSVRALLTQIFLNGG